VPTLARSLASLRVAGWTDPVLVCAEAAPGPLDDPAVEVQVNDPPLGVLHNWVQTLRALLAWTEASHLMVVQDDVTWARGAAAVMARQLPAVAPFWTWYVDPKVGRTLENRIGRSLRAGSYMSPLGYQNNGALCFGFSRILAQAMLHSAELAAYLATHRNQNIDRVIPAVCLALGQPLQVWVPSLVNHALGCANSTIKPKKPRDTRYWRAVAS
jgi:hypothetical protein